MAFIMVCFCISIFFSYYYITPALGFKQQVPVLILDGYRLARFPVDGSATSDAETLLDTGYILPVAVII